MAYTLLNLLRDNVIPRSRLLTDPKDFSAIRIDHICVQELPADGTIRANDVVLTTALGTSADPKKYHDLIAWASGSQAAALMIAPLETDPPVPQQAIDFANECGLPIFLIPWEYYFADIQAAVIENIRKEELHLFSSLRSELFDLYFALQPLSAAVKLIAKRLGLTVDIRAVDGKILSASYDSPEPPVGLLSFVFDITPTDARIGELRLHARDISAVKLQSKQIRKYICFPLSLWFNRHAIETRITAQLKRDFLLNLINESYDSFDEVFNTAQALGFDLNQRYDCIVAQLGGEGDPETASADSRDSLRQLSSFDIALSSLSERMGEAGMIYAEQNYQFILFFKSAPNRPAEQLDHLLDSIEQELLLLEPPQVCDRIYWGICEADAAKTDFRQAFLNASLALQYCRCYGGEKHRFTYRHSHICQAIVAVSKTPALVKAMHETLDPLVEYDGSSRMDLMKTLREFIRCNYNASLTARNLHIHRQSLLYRFEKIEHLTGMSLNEHNDLFLLELYSRLLSDY